MVAEDEEIGGVGGSTGERLRGLWLPGLVVCVV